MYVGEAEIKEGILFTLHGSGRWIRSSPLELSAHSQSAGDADWGQKQFIN